MTDNAEKPTLTDKPRQTVQSTVSAQNKLQREYEVERDKKAASTSADRPKQEWTVIVDLTANKYLRDHTQDGKGNGILSIGAVEKNQKIKELAAQTRGKPITFVVQWANNGEPHSKRGSEIVLGNGDKNAPPKLERYRISNGQVEKLPAPSDKGFAQNLADLTEAAIKDNPSSKVGVMLNADGGGNAGLRGADGSASLADVTDKLKEALSRTDHKKLDVLDYDCCLMAQDGSIKKTADVANNLVATAETEQCTSWADGQNLPEALRGLIDHPELSGGDFAKMIVEQAKNGANDAPVSTGKDGKPRDFDSGANILASFDLTKNSNFNHDLNSFGTALSGAARDSTSRDAIADITREIGKYCQEKSDPNSDVYQNRDLKLFAEKIVEAVNQKKIRDDDDQLKTSAEQVLHSLDDMTTDLHGRQVDNASIEYQKAGGVSVFLPEKGFYDKNQAIKDRLQIMDEMINESVKLANQSKTKAEYDSCALGVTMSGVNNFKQMFDNGNKSVESEQFWKSVTKLMSAQTHEECVKGLNKLQSSWKQLLQRTEFDAALMNEAQRIDKMHQERWKAEASSNEPGWNQFVETMMHS